MDEEKKYGWSIMLFGFAFIIISVISYNTNKSIGTFLTVLDMLMLFGVGIPCIILGSIMTKTAPDFLIKRYGIKNG